MTVQAKVTLKSSTGVAEDDVTNSFHFGGIGEIPASYTGLDTALVAFYTATVGGASNSLDVWLSNRLSRAADACTIKYYDAEAAPPRVPLHTTTFTLGAAGVATILPAEVAIALSYHGTLLGNNLDARKRGRVFLGPFTLLAVEVEGTTTPRPASTLVANMQEMGDYLMTQAGSSSDTEWVVFSKASASKVPPQAVNEAHPIVGGFIDNAFDTIRSRGVDYSSRALWP